MNTNVILNIRCIETSNVTAL